MRTAYNEGRKRLTKKTLKVLEDLMRRTSEDSGRNEFFATGNSRTNWVSDVKETGKSLFVINTRGDIFYTNPLLSSSFFDRLGLCDSKYGQVFLGNIRDYR